jgi:hypothetical protein
MHLFGIFASALSFISLYLPHSILSILFPFLQFFHFFSRYVVQITADRKRKRPAREMTWSTKCPVTRRRGPEDIMTKREKISAEAAAADTVDKLWSLFMTDQMLEKIVQYTNDSIAEEVEQLQYSTERMRKSPYIRPVDMVGEPLFPVHPSPNIYFFIYKNLTTSFFISGYFFDVFFCQKGYNHRWILNYRIS